MALVEQKRGGPHSEKERRLRHEQVAELYFERGFPAITIPKCDSIYKNLNTWNKIILRQKLKIKILTLAADLEKILSSKLNEIGLVAESVDYNKSLFSQIKDSTVLVNGLGKIDKLIIDACPNLKMIHQIGTGTDMVDVDYCSKKSIFVANVPKNNAVSVAEHTLYLMIYLAKNMKQASGSLITRRVLSIMGSELRKKILVIIGLGYTGIEVAKLAKALGMIVIGITKNPSNHTSEKKFLDNVVNIERLSEFISQADYVSIHTPLTEETRNMIGTKELNLMKKSAYLVNVARAALVDRESLFKALSTAQIRGAAFDVFWEEPAEPNDKFLKLDNFLLTPHIAGWTVESVEETVRLIVKNIQNVSRGKIPLTLINSVKS